MNALTAISGTTPFRQIENMFNALANDDRLVFGSADPYPPYNSWFEQNGDCKIEMAVAGFTREELSVDFDGKSLIIRGEKTATTDDTDNDQKRTWVKRGLTRRTFIRRFEVRGTFLLDSAVLKNGVLTITLKDDNKRVSVTIQEE
jgi:HSP20 family molecular chaperone IbpA